MGIMDDAEIREAVFTETDELIKNMEKEIEQYEQDIDNPEHIKKLFRFVHTVKGNAGMLEAEVFVNISHKFEDLLGMIRDGKIKMKEDFFPLFYDVHSLIETMFKKIKNNESIDIDISDSIKNIDTIIKSGVISEEAIVSGKGDLIQDIGKEFREEDTIRVDLKRIDKLVNLLGELHITNKIYTNQFYEVKNRIESINDKVIKDKIEEMEEKILKIDYLMEEMRDSLLNVRMVKVDMLFDRFPGMIRQISRILNKKVNVEFEGRGEEIDKRVLDEMSEPLLHIIRNGVDHGIEMSEERIKKGKSETGKIIIKTYHQGGKIVIEISDDGAGIDVDAVKKKLKKMNIYKEKEIELMSQKEIINSIFLPGFSTKEEVSDISGRGVGMDIVYDRIKKLKGEIEVISEKDKGSTFRIILPMTLSIVDAFSITIGNNEFMFFKDDVDFLLKVEPNEFTRVGNVNVIDYRDDIIPVYDLRDFFKVESNNRIKDSIKNIAVLRYKDNLYGLIVDKFNGLKSVVLKSLGTHIKSLDLFNGTTINEEGKVALVISKSDLIDNIKGLGWQVL